MDSGWTDVISTAHGLIQRFEILKDVPLALLLSFDLFIYLRKGMSTGRLYLLERSL